MNTAALSTLVVTMSACAPSTIWAPATGIGSSLPASSPTTAERPALFLNQGPSGSSHAIGTVEVWQSDLGTSSLPAMLESLRAEALKRGCDAVLVKTSEWIVEGSSDDGRIGIFVSLYVHRELRVDGLRAACLKLDGPQ